MQCSGQMSAELCPQMKRVPDKRILKGLGVSKAESIIT
jgi:hypothetical protein